MEENNQVLIVGGGPIGLLFALVLSHSKIPYTVIDANTSADQSNSRALAYQPFVHPVFQKYGILDEFKRAGFMSRDLVWRESKTGKIIVRAPMPPQAGILHLAQWKLQGVLEKQIREMGGKVELGWKVVEIDDSDPNHIQVTAMSDNGEKKIFKGRYLVGADGGKSFIRKSAGIAFKGETLPYQLIATDVRYPFDKHGFSEAQFMLDPKNYGMIAKINKEGLWRVSFSVPDDQISKEGDIERAVEEKYEAMFPGPRPLKYEITSVAPYKSQQLCAEMMRKGRILLIGDAAHLTSPYAGLGLTSGIFDAVSLAEVLASIITRGAPENALLESWSRARTNIFHKVVDPVSRAALRKVQDPDLETICERDPAFKAMKSGKMMPPPSAATDVSALEGFIS